mgnify:CR=1 FL=1
MDGSSILPSGFGFVEIIICLRKNESDLSFAALSVPLSR